MPRDHAFARGMSMRYVAYEQAGARLGVLPDALAGTFTCPRQATPSLTLSYPNGAQGVRGELLDSAVEIAVELCYDGQTWHEPYNARFTNLSSEWNLIDDGTERRHADLIHIGHRLEGALVWNVPFNSMDKDGKYKFNSRNAGEILRTVWDAAVKRGWGGRTALIGARSSGMVGTAMQPALITPRMQAAIVGQLAPRTSTRLPVARPRSWRSTWAMRSTRSNNAA